MLELAQPTREALIAAAIADYRAGRHTREILEMHGLHGTALYRGLREAGVPLRVPGRRLVRRKPEAETPPDCELRQWCIEQALRWLTITEYHGNGGMVSGSGVQRVVDADLIGRAQKIENWLLGKVVPR